MSNDNSLHDRWARLRFSIIGPLLAAPPAVGELQAALAELAHSLSGVPLRFGTSTIERWYYRARKATDPVGALRPRVRHDAGQPRRFPESLRQALRIQYQSHPRWSYQLHYDNLAVVCAADPTLGPLPSYTTVRRYMKAQGLLNSPGSGALSPQGLRPPPSACNPWRCAASRSPTSMAYGTWISIMPPTRCSPKVAPGSHP